MDYALRSRTGRFRFPDLHLRILALRVRLNRGHPETGSARYDDTLCELLAGWWFSLVPDRSSGLQLTPREQFTVTR